MRLKGKHAAPEEDPCSYDVQLTCTNYWHRGDGELHKIHKGLGSFFWLSNLY